MADIYPWTYIWHHVRYMSALCPPNISRWHISLPSSWDVWRTYIRYLSSHIFFFDFQLRLKKTRRCEQCQWLCMSGIGRKERGKRSVMEMLRILDNARVPLKETDLMRYITGVSYSLPRSANSSCLPLVTGLIFFGHPVPVIFFFSWTCWECPSWTLFTPATSKNWSSTVFYWVFRNYYSPQKICWHT